MPPLINIQIAPLALDAGKKVEYLGAPLANHMSDNFVD